VLTVLSAMAVPGNESQTISLRRLKFGLLADQSGTFEPNKKGITWDEFEDQKYNMTICFNESVFTPEVKDADRYSRYPSSYPALGVLLKSTFSMMSAICVAAEEPIDDGYIRLNEPITFRVYQKTYPPMVHLDIETDPVTHAAIIKASKQMKHLDMVAFCKPERPTALPENPSTGGGINCVVPMKSAVICFTNALHD